MKKKNERIKMEHHKIAAICVFAGVLFFGVFFITGSATVILNDAINERNYFRSLLSTTENYVAMVDDSNRIIYVSNILLQLANVKDSRLVKDRFLIDLFPERELKLLVGKMLMHKRKFAGDWEFTLNGKKRFFKAFSVGLPGTSGTLINLHDFTYIAERDEIAVMKDSLKIGLFFMDSNYVIQDHYSRFLEEILEIKDITGKHFTDLLSDSLNAKDLDSVKYYFEMIFKRNYDQDTLDDINPLNEFQYVCVETGGRKVFHCEFATVERDRGEVFVLVTIYDVTAKTELQQQLLEEENRRQEEMQSIFELIKADRDVFGDFLNDTEYEFLRIDETLKNNVLPPKKILVNMEKKVRFVVDGMDSEAIKKGPRRVIKEVLIQLARNAVVHGIEAPEERIAKGKNETGTIRLSIEILDKNIHIMLGDDGGGLN